MTRRVLLSIMILPRNILSTQLERRGVLLFCSWGCFPLGLPRAPYYHILSYGFKLGIADARHSICAVHGLGGNAFDTWMGVSKMWLRDLLPGSTPFANSRIMTFGYNSTLVNKTSNDRINDWADELLRQVGYVRTSVEERTRPIIFVCHSLGGLVARQAMIRLSTNPMKFDGLKLDRCGLFFLSTPHSGSTQADWNAFLLNACELTLGVRSHEIIKQLQSSNPSSVDSQDAFSAMIRAPPISCLVEGEKTTVAGKARTVSLQVF